MNLKILMILILEDLNSLLNQIHKINNFFEKKVNFHK